MDGAEHIDSGRLGMAIGLTAGAFYLGCNVVMVLVEKESITLFAGSVAHGFNLDSILRSSVGVLGTITGLINTLALGWVTGVLFGLIYNWTARGKYLSSSE